MSRLWNYWEETYEERKLKVFCKFCKGHKQTKHSAKCKKHTSSCIKAPQHIRRMFKRLENDSENVAFIDRSELTPVTVDEETVGEVHDDRSTHVFDVDLPSNVEFPSSQSGSVTIKKYTKTLSPVLFGDKSFFTFM